MGYSRFVSHYPVAVLAAIVLFAVACLVVMVTMGNSRPNFQDPKQGFEPRGTEINRRIRSWVNLLDNTTTGYSHTSYPYPFEKTAHTVGKKVVSQPVFKSYYRRPQSSRNDTKLKTLWKRPSRFFCEEPRKEYARIVYQAIDGGNLFTYENIRAMCSIEAEKIRSMDDFLNVCTTTGVRSMDCCQSWSLGNYVALLNNKSTCFEITASDVMKSLQHLQSCSSYYFNLTLQADCWSWDDDFSVNMKQSGRRNKCERIPIKCWKYNSIYEILHYLTDINFMQNKGKSLHFQPHLTYAITFLPVACGKDTIPLYKQISKFDLSKDNVKVIAIHFDIKYALFDDYLRDDTLWIGVALLFIVLSIWLYTTSLFLTVMTVIAVALSLQIAYFLYSVVFDIKFFPFMNLLTIVIAIGIGADDVFIYCKIWCLAKSERNNGTLDKIVSDTLKHATLSMFVTTFTTAAAFYVNYVSEITAIRCFAIYAGTTVLSNFLLMVTWIPASIVVYEKWCSCCDNGSFKGHKRKICYFICQIPSDVYYVISDWSRVFFEKLLPCIVIKARYLWIAIFGSMGICGVIFVLYKPGLKLPITQEFQVFSRDHPFEVYDFMIRDKFWFEKDAGSGVPMMPIVLIWGVKAVDNGNRLDPKNSGTLVLDGSFNIASQRSQQWLMKFCLKLRRHQYYQASPGMQLTNCFIEHFRKTFMERECVDTFHQSQEPCCIKQKFPYPENIFVECLRQYVKAVRNTPFMFNKEAGARFSKDSGQIVALIVEFNSKIPFSNSYKIMSDFYRTMDEWAEKEISEAPPEIRSGWFISELKFYDLQNTIARGTPVAIGVAVTVSLLVIFLTTLNLLISLYALLTIIVTISITVGSLVLLGWQLGVLESTTISIAVGLSIDFTLHYGVAYRLSPDLDRETRVVCSIERMGSAIAMASVTTFLAGAMMMPSTILAYRHIGTFIMIVMTSSWFCSTFFFQSLLRTIGPQGSFGQFHWPSFQCCSGSREQSDRTVYSMSESTLSTSSANHATNSSETHELEPLTYSKLTRLDQSKVKFSRRPSREFQQRLNGASLSTVNGEDLPKRSRTVEGERSGYDKSTCSQEDDGPVWIKRTDIPVNADVVM